MLLISSQLASLLSHGLPTKVLDAYIHTLTCIADLGSDTTLSGEFFPSHSQSVWESMLSSLLYIGEAGGTKYTSSLFHLALKLWYNMQNTLAAVFYKLIIFSLAELSLVLACATSFFYIAIEEAHCLLLLPLVITLFPFCKAFLPRASSLKTSSFLSSFGRLRLS